MSLIKNFFKKQGSAKQADNDEKENITKSTPKKENAKEKDPKELENEATNLAFYNMVSNVKNTALYKIYQLYCEEQSTEISEPNDFINEMFTEANTDGIFLSSEEKKSFLFHCLTALNKEYDTSYSEKEKAFENMKTGIVANARKHAAENNETEDEAEQKALIGLVNPFLVYDAAVKCFTTKDDMVAYCIITPKLSEGKPFTKEIFNKGLENGKITSNLDEKKTEALIENPKYFRFLRIAKGRPAVDGKDGSIEDLFERSKSIKLKENNQGQVDYKNLGTFSSIQKDDVICNITKAIAGEPGITVKGKVLKAYNGKEAEIPKGEGTALTEDGLALVAALDGYITYESGKFVVKAKMFIEGNVDSSTGNIIFNGDVEVKGDVTSGFTIDVTGNIKVFGVVEGAVLKAGGDISLKGGVSGNNTAKLISGGVVKSLFLENCEVKSTGGVFTESIIQSDIYSDTIIDCLRGKGTIIGGNVHAKEAVMANVIGSRAGKLTNIFIGKSHSSASKQEELEKNIQIEKESYEKISKNVTFLESLPEIPEGKEGLYQQLKEQQVAYAVKIKEDMEELEELTKKKNNFDSCIFKAGVVFEPARLQIGSAKKNLSAGQAMCYRFSSEEKDIIQAPYA